MPGYKFEMTRANFTGVLHDVRVNKPELISSSYVKDEKQLQSPSNRHRSEIPEDNTALTSTGRSCDRSCLIAGNLSVGKFRSPLKHKLVFLGFLVLGSCLFYLASHDWFQCLMKLEKERKQNTDINLGTRARTLPINCPVPCCNLLRKAAILLN